MIKQNSGDQNCIAVVAAMAFSQPLNGLKEYIGHEPPYTDVEFMQYGLKHNFLVGLGGVSGEKVKSAGEFINGESGLVDVSDSESKIEDLTINYNINLRLGNTEAFVVVKNSKGKEHAIYWNGENVLDPDPMSGTSKGLMSYDILRFYPIWELP